MIDWSELKERGWTHVRDVSSKAELLQVASLIGQPLSSPTGELVKELVPTPAGEARDGTLSNTYGLEAFPLHTDTAFWPVPARYLVFRAYGDIRRETTVLTFDELFRGERQKLRDIAERSIWIARTPSASFYCSMRVAAASQNAFRFDGQCMRPINSAAFSIREALGPLLSYDYGQRVDWRYDVAIIVDNWRALHARGPSPKGERRRVIERVYVK